MDLSAAADVEDNDRQETPFNPIEDPIVAHPEGPLALPGTSERLPGMRVRLQKQEGRSDSRMQRAIVTEKPSVGLVCLALKDDLIRGQALGRSPEAFFPSSPS